MLEHCSRLLGVVVQNPVLITLLPFAQHQLLRSSNENTRTRMRLENR